tara:strand:- start:692 stop:2095 length:1404 start_codon:yes stop_codon:yes gene_type:complete
MKKKTFHLPFKSNFFKEQDPFHFVLVFFIIFFGTAIFFSIPTFYDYKKYNQKIEETINKEFKIKLYNLENISFKFIPSPHLLIKKANFKIKDSETDSIAELKNIKIYISISEFYKTDNFKIKKIIVSKANLYLNAISLQNFIQNLKKSIVNHFIIKNSTLFFKDNKNEIILISKIKNLDYKNDFVNKKKILKMDGNIFDSNYKFKYFIDYKEPNIQNAILELKSPNLTFENKLIEDFLSPNFNQNGSLDIEFLNNKNSLNYNIEGSKINFLNKSSKNSNFDLNGLIDFSPFNFNLEIDLKKIDLIEIEKLIYLIYMNQNTIYENLSGNIKINFNNINFKSMKKGNFTLKFENSKIILKEKLFFLDDFASIEIVDFEYLESSDPVLQMKIKVNILDKIKFNRYLFHYKKNRIDEKNLYFTYRYNVNSLKSFISQVSNVGFLNSVELYQFNNFQQLKNLLRDDKILKLD